MKSLFPIWICIVVWMADGLPKYICSVQCVRTKPGHPPQAESVHLGTGFFISADTLLTTFHAIAADLPLTSEEDTANPFFCASLSGPIVAPIQVASTYPEVDLAILVLESGRKWPEWAALLVERTPPLDAGRVHGYVARAKNTNPLKVCKKAKRKCKISYRADSLSYGSPLVEAGFPTNLPVLQLDRALDKGMAGSPVSDKRKRVFGMAGLSFRKVSSPGRTWVLPLIAVRKHLARLNGSRSHGSSSPSK